METDTVRPAKTDLGLVLAPAPRLPARLVLLKHVPVLAPARLRSPQEAPHDFAGAPGEDLLFFHAPMLITLIT